MLPFLTVMAVERRVLNKQQLFFLSFHSLYMYRKVAVHFRNLTSLPVFGDAGSLS